MKTPGFFILSIFFAGLFAGLFAPRPAELFAQTQRDAVAEYHRGNYAVAAEICRDEIATNDQNIESYIVLCWSLLKLSRYAEAAQFVATATEIRRYDVRLLEIKGELDYYGGRNLSALEYFEEYINLAPEGSRIDLVYYFIGEIYIRLGRYKHADIALSTALHYTPGNAQWWTRLAYAREMSGDMRDSEQAYRQAITLDPNLTDARRGLERTRAAIGMR